MLMSSFLGLEEKKVANSLATFFRFIELSFLIHRIVN